MNGSFSIAAAVLIACGLATASAAQHPATALSTTLSELSRSQKLDAAPCPVPPAMPESFSIHEVPGWHAPKKSVMKFNVVGNDANKTHFGQVEVRRDPNAAHGNFPHVEAGGRHIYHWSWSTSEGVLFKGLVVNYQPFHPISIRDCNGKLLMSFFQHISIAGGAGGAMNMMGGGAMGGGDMDDAASNKDSHKRGKKAEEKAKKAAMDAITGEPQYVYELYDASGDVPPKKECVQDLTQDMSPFIPTVFKQCMKKGKVDATAMLDDVDFLDGYKNLVAQIKTTKGNSQSVKVFKQEGILSDNRLLIFFAANKAFRTAKDSGIHLKEHKSLIGIVSGTQKLPPWVYISIGCGLCVFLGICAAYFKFVHGDDKDMAGIHRP
jgi:hypothetical protein